MNYIRLWEGSEFWCWKISDFDSSTDWFFYILSLTHSSACMFVCFMHFYALLLRGSEKFSRTQFFYSWEHFSRKLNAGIVSTQHENWQHFTLSYSRPDEMSRVKNFQSYYSMKNLTSVQNSYGLISEQNYFQSRKQNF